MFFLSTVIIWQSMQKDIKPSWTTKLFLTFSSIVIFMLGMMAAVTWDGVEIFNTMCLVIPFFTAYVWFSKVKRIAVYLLLDIHFIWWVLLSVVSSISKNELFFNISLVMILIIYYAVLRRKYNYILA